MCTSPQRLLHPSPIPPARRWQHAHELRPPTRRSARPRDVHGCSGARKGSIRPLRLYSRERTSLQRSADRGSESRAAGDGGVAAAVLLVGDETRAESQGQGLGASRSRWVNFGTY